MRISREKLRIIVILLAGVFILFAFYIAMGILEDKLSPAPIDSENLPGTSSYNSYKTVFYDGNEYRFKYNIKTVLVLGIDNDGPMKASGSYNNSGQADFSSLLVFDEEAKTCTVLHLNRDTMTQIPVLGVSGKRAGSITGQLALAYTYGSGLVDSCRNSSEAVSLLLYGVPVNNCIAFNMDAVSRLCDILGGVSVTVHDDFSDIDDTLVMGETVFLTGEKALTYIRARGSMNDSTNLARMERQKQFLFSLAGTLKAELAQNEDFSLNLFNAVSEYMSTDYTVEGLSSAMERFADYELTEIVSPKGEPSYSGEFAEYYVDSDALRTLVLDLFYSVQQ